MRNLIFQAWTGPTFPGYAKQSVASIGAYAESIGAEHVLFTGPFNRHDGTPETNPYFSTFAPFYTGAWDQYDSMLYVDCDCLAANGAPDVFRENPYADFGMVHLLDGPCREGKEASVREHGELAGYPSTSGHANAGVVLWSEEGARDFNHYLSSMDAPYESEGLPSGDLLFGGNDQALLNHWGRATTATRLSCRWNYHLGQFVPEQRFALPGIVHYHSQARGMLAPDFESGRVWR